MTKDQKDNITDVGVPVVGNEQHSMADVGMPATSGDQSSMANVGMPAASGDQPSMADRDPYLGITLKGRYFIEKVLGHGGIGIVYLARDKELLSKPVVIKVLL